MIQQKRIYSNFAKIDVIIDKTTKVTRLNFEVIHKNQGIIFVIFYEQVFKWAYANRIHKKGANREVNIKIIDEFVL